MFQISSFAKAVSLLLSLSKEAGEKRKRTGVSVRRPGGGTPPGERPRWISLSGQEPLRRRAQARTAPENSTMNGVSLQNHASHSLSIKSVFHYYKILLEFTYYDIRRIFRKPENPP